MSSSRPLLRRLLVAKISVKAVTPRIPEAQFKHLKQRWKVTTGPSVRYLQSSLVGALFGPYGQRTTRSNPQS
jgi:hypothetical protein